MARNTRYKGIRKLGERLFHVRVSMTDPRTGKRKERKGTIEGDINDALGLRERLRAELTEGPGERAKRRRIAEFAAQWMERKRGEVTKASADRYAVALDQYILPVLGELYFDALTREDVQAWVDGQLGEGFAVRTVQSRLRVLTTMTRDALAEIGVGADPTGRIRFPDYEEGAKSEAITPAELERFLAAMRQDHPDHFGLVTVLAYTGLRFCHASALRWEDWDETRGVLCIRRSQVNRVVSRVRRRKRAPKQLPVLPVVGETLAWHRGRMQARGQGEGWMFPTGVGTLRSSSSLTRAFKECCARAGITARFSPHGLRYTFTDVLRHAGIDPVVRRELVGHHTERMQLNYSTVRLHEHRDALSRMAELVGGEEAESADGAGSAVEGAGSAVEGADGAESAAVEDGCRRRRENAEGKLPRSGGGASERGSNGALPRSPAGSSPADVYPAVYSDGHGDGQDESK